MSEQNNTTNAANGTNAPAAKKTVAKKAAKKAAASTPQEPKVKHYCGKQPIIEGGKRYAPGERIKGLSAKRAKALDHLITDRKPEK